MTTDPRTLECMIPKNYMTLPNILTFIRLVASPLLLPFLIVYLLPYHYLPFHIGLAIIFLGLSFTDFLDGYFARKQHLTSALGGALDHIADKFLTYATFIALLTVGKIYFFWVILFIGRDLFVMGLRQIALEHHFSVPVGYLGKIKTVLQMILITWIILEPKLFITSYTTLDYAYVSLLSITLFATIGSAGYYAHSFFDTFEKTAISSPTNNKS